jgi:hypothetical protein
MLKYTNGEYGKLAKILIKLNCDICRGEGSGKGGNRPKVDCEAEEECHWYPLHPYRNKTPGKDTGRTKKEIMPWAKSKKKKIIRIDQRKMD